MKLGMKHGMKHGHALHSMHFTLHFILDILSHCIVQDGSDGNFSTTGPFKFSDSCHVPFQIGGGLGGCCNIGQHMALSPVGRFFFHLENSKLFDEKNVTRYFQESPGRQHFYGESQTSICIRKEPMQLWTRRQGFAEGNMALPKLRVKGFFQVAFFGKVS